MSTLVCFHAHPDDESISTAGTMARAARAGHRVVLVVATRGERGEIVPGVLAEGEQLALRRTAETYASAEALGVDRVEFLGYVDSGMAGTQTATEPWCFARADVARAGARLAVILDEEQPEVVTVYDSHGGYGHPDHIAVHRVGHEAAARAGVGPVYEATINRTHIERLRAQRAASGTTEDPRGPDLDERPEFGTPEADITHRTDVTGVLGPKRDAMRAHRSQIADEHFLLAMGDEAFSASMGTEWFIATGPPGEPGPLAAALFEPLR